MMLKESELSLNEFKSHELNRSETNKSVNTVWWNEGKTSVMWVNNNLVHAQL